MALCPGMQTLPPPDLQERQEHLLIYREDRKIDHEASACKLKQLVAASDLTLTQLAARMGIAISSLSEALNAKRNWTEHLAWKLISALKDENVEPPAQRP